MIGTPTNAADVLCAAVRAAGSPVCVGLDPVLESIPGDIGEAAPHDRIESFSRGVLEAVRGISPAIKFQSACYERYGWQGVRALENAMKIARDLGFVVILDAKRGDIGISATHYAAAACNAGAHFITVNGYLGVSGIQPFLKEKLGVFVLVRTSNPDSAAIQAEALKAGGTVADLMASSVSRLGTTSLGSCGLSDVGAVVGATQSSEGAALRRNMPDQILLIPGFGAQGGKADDIRSMVRPSQSFEHAGVLVTASRSVIYPERGGIPWQDAIRAAAVDFATQIRTVTTVG
ncbi:MAG: orotidine-5'-phosphate decarboxylase [Phycisphaeraceae bacterium]|nr:orotidine-5'-phosphate decarboxylase [Phycisphaeraceae bacterium]